MMQHTKGKWKREGQDIVGERYICTLSDWALVGLGTQYDEQERALQQEQDANGRLLAAAPDLLAALKDLLKRCAQLDQSATHNGLTNCDAIAKARQVVAQAEGDTVPA